MESVGRVGRTVSVSRDEEGAQKSIGNVAEQPALWANPGSAGTPRPTFEGCAASEIVSQDRVT